MKKHMSLRWLFLLLVVFFGLAAYASISERVELKKDNHLHRIVNSTAGKFDDHRTCGVAYIQDQTLSLPSPQKQYKATGLKGSKDEVGDIRTFTAIDFASENQDKIDIVARAEKKGIHAYFYVDTTLNFDNSQLDEILSLFDNLIYFTNTEVFGSEPRPGIDGDLRITILFLDIREAAGSSGEVAGYFWSGNQFPKNQVPKSNEREMLYIDITRLSRFGVEDVAGTIAHEFQHLIHWNYDRDEDIWVNEGLSEYATVVNGLGISNSPALFLNNPDKTLMVWENHPRDYARVFLWILYLAEHYGGNALIRDIVANPGAGLSAQQAVINVRQPGVTIKQIFANWIIANYLDLNSGNIDYSYPSLDLPALRPTQTFGFLPVGTRNAEVNTYAADYYLFSGGENLLVRLNGPGNDAEFRAKVIRLKANSAPEVLDFPLDFNRNGSLSFPDFGITFDQLLLIPYYTEDLIVNPMTNYEFEAEGSGGLVAFLDTLQYHDNESTRIISLGLPSPVIDSEHLDAYAVRFTPPSDGALMGAELGVWRRTGSGGAVRFFVYESVGDSGAVPGAKLDSVDVQNITGSPGSITWNAVDFSSKNIQVTSGEEFHIGWEFVNAGFGDSVFAILDTAKVPTNRSSVFVRERQGWTHFVDGFNFFMRAILSIPADPTVPEITAGILQNPVLTEVVDVFVIGENALNPVSVEGQISLSDSLQSLKFRSVDESNKVFVDDNYRLKSSGEAELLVSARNAFGVVVGRDTLRFNIDLVDPKIGGKISSVDGDFGIEVPATAIEKPTYFTTHALEDNFQTKDAVEILGDDQYIATGLGYTVGPAGVEYKQAVELTFRYGENGLAAVSENNLAIAYLGKDGWEILGGELYRQSKEIRVLVNHTGSFSLVIREFKEEALANIPDKFYLNQNYPNPFNPITTIKFGLPESNHTTLRIINLRGQVISTLIDENLKAGEHVVEWDGTDDRKVKVASGVYLFQIKAGEFVDTKKLVLVK